MRHMNNCFMVEHEDPGVVSGNCTYCGSWGTIVDGEDGTKHTTMCDALHVVELRLAKLGDK